MRPMISIVVPVYQVQEYIENSIKSIVNQSFKSFEVILVNDGTRDRSVEIALGILKGTNINYTLVNQDNKGLAAARNIGISRSKGIWIVCVDSDDIIAREFLDRLYKAGVKYNTDVVISSFQLVNRDNIFTNYPRINKDIMLLKSKILYMFLKRQIKILAPGMLIKKEYIERNNLWYDEDIKFAEDQDFIWRVVLHATSVAIVKDKLYNYLVRDNSITSSSSKSKVLTGYNGIKNLEKKILEKGAVKRFILSRWVIGALHTSSRMMDFCSFSDLADKMEYRRHTLKLLIFPDIRVIILSFLLLISMKFFYKIAPYLK
jgi:glycosyltransferase involved in cell wall biosynthesis